MGAKLVGRRLRAAPERHCYRGACSRAQGVRARRPGGVESPRRLKRRPNSRLPLQRTEWSLTGGTSADAAETSAPPKSNSMKIASEMLSLCGPSMPSTLASVTHECAPCSLLSRLSPLLFACSGRIVSLLDSLSDSRPFASNNWKSNTLGGKTSRNAGDLPDQQERTASDNCRSGVIAMQNAHAFEPRRRPIMARPLARLGC